MRVKKVNRYYCEFCKKSGQSASHISKHEKRCTLNPNRHCGMCAMLENEQPGIKDLLSVLPNPTDYIICDKIDDTWNILN